MVSLLHEGVIKLVRDRPAFAAELLGGVLQVEVPGFNEARLAEAALNVLVPAEYRADAVVVFERDAPVFGAIIEAQLQPDDDKLFTWPLYAVVAREPSLSFRRDRRDAGPSDGTLGREDGGPRRRRAVLAVGHWARRHSEGDGPRRSAGPAAAGRAVGAGSWSGRCGHGVRDRCGGRMGDLAVS